MDSEVASFYWPQKSVGYNHKSVIVSREDLFKREARKTCLNQFRQTLDPLESTGIFEDRRQISIQKRPCFNRQVYSSSENEKEKLTYE